MRIQQQRMTCACGHVFEVELVMDAPVAVVLASMKAVRCSACGGKKIYLGGACNDAPSPTGPISISERALWWRQHGETGTSSLTIHSAFVNRVYFQARWLHDADDYRRCRALLDLIPEWRADLSPVVTMYPWMKPFVDRWNEFDWLWDTGEMEALGILLRISGVEAEDIREEMRMQGGAQ